MEISECLLILIHLDLCRARVSIYDKENNSHSYSSKSGQCWTEQITDSLLSFTPTVFEKYLEKVISAFIV